ncbi:MAG: RCKP-type rubredoxin-like domain-containing protein [Bacillota bacterium]
MAVFVCAKCGATRETRCKPRKCPQCGASDSFTKKEESK